MQIKFIYLNITNIKLIHMKKITLLVAAFGLAIFSSNAQSLEATANTSVFTQENNSQAVIWDQPSEGGNGIVTGINNTGTGVFSADDFLLEDGVQIEQIFAIGFNNNGNLIVDLQGVNIYIYANDEFLDVPDGDPSDPSSSIMTLELNVGDAALDVDFTDGVAITVDVVAANGEALELQPGRYWLSVAAVMNIPDFDGGNRFNWFRGTPGNPDDNIEAHLIDVNDVFGGGFTEWTSFTNLGITDWGDLAFTLEGQIGLSTASQSLADIAIFPNPTSNIVHVRLPSSVEVSNSTLRNVLGADTGIKMNNNTVDLSSLANGIYLLTIETNRGTLTQKVVKK